MNKSLIVSLLALLFTVSIHGQERWNHLNFGLTATTWGFGVMASANFTVAPNIAVGPLASFTFDVDPIPFTGYRYTYNTFAVGGKVDYYLDEVLNLPEMFDVYGGGNAGFAVVSGKHNYPAGYAYVDTYSARSSTVFIRAEAGGRYYFRDNLSVFAEVTSGYGSSAGRAGLSLDL